MVKVGDKVRGFIKQADKPVNFIGTVTDVYRSGRMDVANVECSDGETRTALVENLATEGIEGWGNTRHNGTLFHYFAGVNPAALCNRRILPRGANHAGGTIVVDGLYDKAHVESWTWSTLCPRCLARRDVASV